MPPGFLFVGMSVGVQRISARARARKDGTRQQRNTTTSTTSSCRCGRHHCALWRLFVLNKLLRGRARGDAPPPLVFGA